MDPAIQPENTPEPVANPAELAAAAAPEGASQLAPELRAQVRTGLLKQFIDAAAANFNDPHYGEKKNDILKQMERELISAMKQEYDLGGDHKKLPPAKAHVLRTIASQVSDARKEIYHSTRNPGWLLAEASSHFGTELRSSADFKALEQDALDSIAAQEPGFPLTARHIHDFVAKNAAFFAASAEQYRIVEHCLAVAESAGIEAAMAPSVRFEAIKAIWPTPLEYIAAVERLNDSTLAYKLSLLELAEITNGRPDHVARASISATTQIQSLNRLVAARAEAPAIYGPR